MNNLISGYAPCGGCGKMIYNVPLLAGSKEPDGKGGYWCKVDGCAKCLNCGEPMVWFHQPGTIDLEQEFFANIKISLED